MRRASAIAIVSAALILVQAVTPAGASAATPPVRLTIVTLPKLVGIRFALDGRTFVTGRSGYARIETTPGTHLLRAIDTSVRRPGTRSTFLRWSDGRFTGIRTITIAGNTRLDVGYRQSVLVHFRFTDPAGRPVVGRVTRMTLSNTLGGQPSFRPDAPHWLPAISVTRRYGGLGQTLVRYSIKQALVGGSNVVNQAQQRFYPALTRHVTARLLLYSARVRVRDFLLGTAAGSRLQLVYPNGTRSTYSLHGDELRLSSLPRGTYQVDVRGGGYVPTVSLALSRNQVLKVRVISYLDMFLFLVMALAAVSVLALVARPYLRLRLRSMGTGRQPTLDDLEPIKPLSGARKELIVRYMVPTPALPQTARSVQRLPVRAAHRIAVEGAENRPAQRLRRLPRRMRAAAADRLRGLQDSRRRILRPLRLPAAQHQPPREALSGERIELVHVYMGETIAPAGKVVAPGEQEPLVEAAPTAPEIDEPAQPVQTIPLPEPVEAAAPASETVVAPRPLDSGAPPRSEPSVAGPAAPEKDDAAPKPKRTRTPARKKTPTRAKAKTATSATQKASRAGSAKPKAKTSKAKAKKAAPAGAAQAKTVAPAKRRATRTATKPKTKKAMQATEQAAIPGKTSPSPAPEGTADSQDVAQWPHLAAAVEALREDLRKAKTTPPKRRKRASTDAETPAPAKPRAARSSTKPKKTKPTKATDQAAAQGPASSTSRAANGVANIEELAHFRPDLAAAVEALQEDLRNARTATTKKGRRKSSAEAR